MGERDIHTKLLEIPIQKFSTENEKHIAIASLAERAYVTIKEKYEKHEITEKLSKQRNIARSIATEHLIHINKIVKKLLNIIYVQIKS
jgi:hypothetical protein